MDEGWPSEYHTEGGSADAESNSSTCYIAVSATATSSGWHMAEAHIEDTVYGTWEWVNDPASCQCSPPSNAGYLEIYQDSFSMDCVSSASTTEDPHESDASASISLSGMEYYCSSSTSASAYYADNWYGWAVGSADTEDSDSGQEWWDWDDPVELESWQSTHGYAIAEQDLSSSTDPSDPLIMGPVGGYGFCVSFSGSAHASVDGGEETGQSASASGSFSFSVYFQEN